MKKTRQFIYVFIAVLIGLYLIGKLGGSLTKKATELKEDMKNSNQEKMDLIDDTAKK